VSRFSGHHRACKSRRWVVRFSGRQKICEEEEEEEEELEEGQGQEE